MEGLYPNSYVSKYNNVFIEDIKTCEDLNLLDYIYPRINSKQFSTNGWNFVSEFHKEGPINFKVSSKEEALRLIESI